MDCRVKPGNDGQGLARIKRKFDHKKRSATRRSSAILIGMYSKPARDLPSAFKRLAWSNLAAQSAEQISLAAAPIVAVLLLGVGEGKTGLLQTALTLPFILFSIPAGLLTDR